MAKRRTKGDGGIERVGGKWKAIISRVVNGKRIRSSKTFDKAADAQAWLRQHAETGPTAPLTLGGWIDQWLELHKARNAPKTYATDKWTVEKYLRPVFGVVRLRDLAPVKIEAAIRKLEISENEKHKAARTLRNILNAAVVAGHIAVSPMKRVRMPKRKVAEVESLTEGDLAKLLDAAEAMGSGPMFLLWVDSGLRPSELLALKWKDLDLDAGTIRIERAMCPTTNQLKEPKTRKGRRTLPLSEPTLAALKTLERGQDDAPIFHPPSSESGKHWWPHNFAKWVFRPIVNRSGVKCTPYTMRHTCATLLLRAGVNLKVVSERLGHEDVTLTLKTYAHCLPDEQQRAAVAMGEIIVRSKAENTGKSALPPDSPQPTPSKKRKH